MEVLIGIDPHKRSHHAVAIDREEVKLAELSVRAAKDQTQHLLAWAARFPDRRWAIESAGGLGYLPSQQLVRAGEDVIDVPATLAARVRVLGSGRSQKNDPNDALSTAIAALRHRGLREVHADDHRAILRMLATRHHDLGSLRTQAACRLHAALAALIPGGFSGRLSAKTAAALLRSLRPTDGVNAERKAQAADLLADVRRLDAAIAAVKKRIVVAVEAAKTSTTDVYGVGPVVAAIIVGHTGDVCRFATRHHYASYNGTAPLEASSGTEEAPSSQPAWQPPAQSRHAHGGGDPDPQRHARPGLLRAQDRRGQDEEGGAARTQAAHLRCRLPPVGSRRRAVERAGPGGQPGATLTSSAAGRSLNAGTSDRPLPNPTRTLCPSQSRAPENMVLTQRGIDLERSRQRHVRSVSLTLRCPRISQLRTFFASPRTPGLAPQLARRLVLPDSFYSPSVASQRGGIRCVHEARRGKKRCLSSLRLLTWR
jgi:transposase